jgi:hypothetical protein
MAITGADIARGQAAEAAFAAWLDRSCLPFVYATQTRESVPRHFRGQLKRPDYLVAVPMVGTLCFDVKAKTRYRGGFIFDRAEVTKLAAFDELFNLTTLFACLDPDGGTASWWFRVADLDRRPDDRPGGRLTVSVRDGLTVDLERPFQEALRDLVSL